MSVKISLKEKLGFSLGEYSSSIVWQTLMFFLPVFYTDIFGLTATAAGTMFLVVRIFDAFNDPIMGIIADNTKTRWGSFRPYLLFMALPYGVAAVLMFSVPDFSETGKLIYAYTTYMLMMIIYTAIMIPYNALVGVISSNPSERTTISSFKFVFAYAAGMTVQGLVLPMVDWLGNGNEVKGYRITMIIFGIICVLFFIISFLSSKERIKTPSKQKLDVRKDLKNLFKNKVWVIIFITALLMLIYIAIRSAVIVYFFDYFINDKAGASMFMVIGTLAVLLGVLPTKWLASKIGKKKLFIISLIIISISSFGLYFSNKNLFWLYFFQITFSFASGPTMPLMWSMLADAADFGQWKFKRRNTALIYSAATFGQKAGFSIGGAVSLWVLAWFGYVANQPQSAEAIHGIRICISFLPGIIALLCVVVLYFYPLSDKKLIEINKEINKEGYESE